VSGRRAKRERKLARLHEPPRRVAPVQALSEPLIAQRYEELHYPGDVTGSDQAQPGALLGHDELGRPYEVLDAEYDAAADRTTVNLQYATPANLRAALDGLAS
jgi:hypothetical protein